MNRLRHLFLPLTLACLAAPCVTATTLFVSPKGQAGAAGTEVAPLGSLVEAVERAQAGDVIRLAGGTYKEGAAIRLEKSGTASAPIRIERSDNSKLPHLEFTSPSAERRSNGLSVLGDYWQIMGLEITGASGFGIGVTGHHNVVEQCRTHDNGNTGINIGAPGSHNLILNCDSFRNVDRPTKGQNADGFGAKFQVGPGNIFRGCRAWENADDGFDLWKAPHPVRIEYCVAFRNGVDLWGIDGYTGNGNGFKLGGDFIPAAHVVIGCVVMDQPKRGFDQNNNTAPLTIEQCTATNCLYGFSFTLKTASGDPHVLRDNLSRNAPAILVEGTVQERNLWTSDSRQRVLPTIVESTPVTKGPQNPPKIIHPKGP